MGERKKGDISAIWRKFDGSERVQKGGGRCWGKVSGETISGVGTSSGRQLLKYRDRSQGEIGKGEGKLAGEKKSEPWG